MHSTVGLCLKIIYNPLESSQRLRLPNTCTCILQKSFCIILAQISQEEVINCMYLPNHRLFLTWNYHEKWQNSINFVYSPWTKIQWWNCMHTLNECHWMLSELHRIVTFSLRKMALRWKTRWKVGIIWEENCSLTFSLMILLMASRVSQAIFFDDIIDGQ